MNYNLLDQWIDAALEENHPAAVRDAAIERFTFTAEDVAERIAAALLVRVSGDFDAAVKALAPAVQS